jgi:hypothetical protein
MGEEPDDDGALRGAETAVGTGDVPALGWAYYNFPAGRGSDSVGGIGWQDDDDRAAIHVGQFVGFGEGIGR